MTSSSLRDGTRRRATDRRRRRRPRAAPRCGAARPGSPTPARRAPELVPHAGAYGARRSRIAASSRGSDERANSISRDAACRGGRRARISSPGDASREDDRDRGPRPPGAGRPARALLERRDDRGVRRCRRRAADRPARWPRLPPFPLVMLVHGQGARQARGDQHAGAGRPAALSRPARHIISRCGAVHRARRSAHGCRAIPRATAGAASPAGRSTPPPDPPAAARPGRAASPSACGSASPAATGRGSRGSVGTTSSPGRRRGRGRPPVVGRRDEPELAVEDAEQVRRSPPGGSAIARRLQQLRGGPHVPLDVRAASGSRAFSTARAAFWWSRCSGGPGRELNVSSRNVTPTPSVPPTSFSVAGVHGLPLTISANRASRTEMTLPSWARPATSASRNRSCSADGPGGPSGSLPKARPNARQDLPGVARSNRSTAAKLCPSTSRTSSSHEPGRRHPEVIPDHHEAWTRPPSHCRRASTSSVSCSPPGRAATARTGRARAPPSARRASPAPQRGERLDQPQVVRQARQPLPQAPQEPGLGLVRRSPRRRRRRRPRPAGAAAPP